MSEIIRNYYNRYYQYRNKYPGLYVVHLYASDIGIAEQGSPVTDFSSLAAEYNARKTKVLIATKNQYQRLFINSLDSQSQQLLSDVFSNDDLMSELNTELGKQLKSALSIDKMAKLMEAQRAILGDTGISQKFADDILKNTKTGIQNLNKVLKAMSECAKITFGQETGKLLGDILVHDRIYNKKKRETIGQGLQNAINSFKVKAQGQGLTQFQLSQMNLIVEKVNALTHNLITGKTAKNDKDISAQGLMKNIDAIFNTGFAESVAAMPNHLAQNVMGEAVKPLLTGATKVSIQYTDAYGQKAGYSEQIKQGKADFKLNNAQMAVFIKENKGRWAQMEINLGISNKFYRGAHFPGLDKKHTVNVSSGSAGSFKQALEAVFLNEHNYLKNMYLAQNVIAHNTDPEIKLAYEKLKQLFSIRQVVRAFATRGGQKDFAQFMFINGDIIPIWDIIMNVAGNNRNAKIANISMQTSEMIKIEDKNGKETSVNRVQHAATTWQKYPIYRLRNVNKALQSSKIEMELKLNYKQ